MKYDVVLSIIFYLCGCFYMLFGAVLIAANAKSNVNKLFLFLTSSLAIWSFSYSISNSAPTAEVSAYWRSFSVFGWGFFSSFLLHMIWILTKFKSRFNRRSIVFMLHLPALINIILFGPFGFLAEKHYNMVQTDFGWINLTPMYAGKIWLHAYFIVFTTASIILLGCWWRKIDSHTPEKREAKRFIVSTLVLFLITAAADVLPDILGINNFPKPVVVFYLVPTITLFSLLKKTGLIIKETSKPNLLPDASEEPAGDRLRLFKTVSVIFILGSTLSFLIGYFGMNRTLEYELLLAAFLLIMGIILRFIPSISRRRSVQNSIFLAISLAGLLYFMIKDSGTGALTIWTVYILFFLFTVILDSPIHTFIYASVTVIIQIVLWIVRPEVPVIIDGNEYVTRIFIIVLSFIGVRYLTAEYALKIEAYQKLAKEQEILEKISSSFITINSENAHEKIDEMMRMAAEILEFNQAFLTEFSQDHEDATILNMYVNDIESELFTYNLGFNFKIADYPFFKLLLNRSTPIICEDTTSFFFDEDVKQREYFTSRGVNSFIAIPVTTDHGVGAVFAIEYNDKPDTSLTQSRLNFLQIIANVLGDAKRKLLAEEQLYQFAFVDESTKLANRNMLRKRLGEIINNGRGSDQIAILDIEIENLRMINDTFGHSIGEKVMAKSAAILKNQFENCSFISRAGDEEFVVVMPDVKNSEQLEECARRLLDSFSQPVSTETGIEALFAIVHMGISMYPGDGRDADTLLKNADLARFEAKNTNEKIVFYTERLESNIAENTLFTNRLFKSLENEEFFLEYQPQISCETGKTAGVEALLRWKTDGNKRIPPDRFVPILEQTGLIYDVGIWVLDQALQEHNRLIAKGFPPLRFSVNLSVVQFQNNNFIRDIRKTIEGNRVHPKYVELEITESLFSKNTEDSLEKLHQLKELGVNIAIDDFGKGYSSLNRLKLVPFDRIKIDKVIIDYIDLENKKAPITEIIILLAKAFSAGITAEGVETKEQADFLKSIACDEIQGYYYSKPLSAESLEEYLKKD